MCDGKPHNRSAFIEDKGLVSERLPHLACSSPDLTALGLRNSQFYVSQARLTP